MDGLGPQDWNGAMSIRTSRWPAGVPCWADLTAPDLDAAKAFYAEVLGWTFADTGAEFGGYTIAQSGGAAAAGIGPEQPGTPNAWTLYFASDDAAATEAAVAEHGGTVLVPTGDVGDLGRLFIALDPTGATFGVWEGRAHIGAGITNEPGGLTWEDLRSPDPEAARAFYRAVFGLRTDELPAAGADYATFSVADEEIVLGGMGGMEGADGTPAHWIIYFGVPDAAAAAAAAERAGGAVVVPHFESPYGRMAGITDPAGALFWVIETDWATQPDRTG